MFITGVNDTSDKLFSVVNDTGKKLSLVSNTPAINLCHRFSVIAGVVDTGEQFIAGDNDIGDNFIAGDKKEVGAAKDRRKLKGINRQYLRPPKLATAADNVIGTAMKSCIHKFPTHLDQRPLRLSKLNNAVLV
jgi:hypothetical protein